MPTERKTRGDGLHRKKFGVWYFGLTNPLTGRYRVVSTRTKAYQEARQVRIEYLEKLRTNKLPTDQAQWPAKDAIEHYLEYVDATAGAKRTAKWKRVLARPLLAFFGAMRLEEITSLRLKAYQADRLKAVRFNGSGKPRPDGSTISPDTVNRELAKVLIPVLKEAKLWDALKPTYKPLTVKRCVRGRALTHEQEAALLNVLAGNKHWAVEHWCARLALRTGMRGEEIKGLRLVDIHLGDKPAVTVPRDITKTDAGERRIPLSSEACFAIHQLLELAAAKGATEPTHYLLPADLSKHTKAKDPLNGRKGHDAGAHQESFTTVWEAARTAAGVPWLRFHDLRHTFITRCAEAGVAIEKVMAIVGHMSPEMTRYYTHLCDATLRDVVDQVEAATVSAIEPMLAQASTAAQTTARECRSPQHRA